eukprot:GGOE01061917.1.p1 GENE.GGOE01061917.1~~GGOE01061917.1.p1  ORF type:complete len:463 (+),score=59.08 GGOE01061917.1:60-1448(+)
MGLFNSCVRGEADEPFSPRQAMPRHSAGAGQQPGPRPPKGPGGSVAVGQLPLQMVQRWAPQAPTPRRVLLPNLLQLSHGTAVPTHYSLVAPPPLPAFLPSSPLLSPTHMPFPGPCFCAAVPPSPRTAPVETSTVRHATTFHPFPVPFPQTVYAEPAQPPQPRTPRAFATSHAQRGLQGLEADLPGGLTYQQIFITHKPAPMDPAMCEPMPTRTEGYQPRRGWSVPRAGTSRTRGRSLSDFPENAKSLSPDVVKVQLFPPPKVQARSGQANYSAAVDPIPFPNLDREFRPVSATFTGTGGPNPALQARDSFRSSLGPKTVLFGETTAYSPLPHNMTSFTLSQSSIWDDQMRMAHPAQDDALFPRSWQTMDLGSNSYQAPSTVVSMTNGYRLPSRRSSLVSTHVHSNAFPSTSPGLAQGPTIVAPAMVPMGDDPFHPWPPLTIRPRGGRRLSAPAAPGFRPAVM